MVNHLLTNNQHKGSVASKEYYFLNLRKINDRVKTRLSHQVVKDCHSDKFRHMTVTIAEIDAH